MSTTTTVRRALTVLVAALAALTTWFVVMEVAGVDLVVRAGGAVDRITALPVVLASTAAALAGWGVLAVLERVTRHPARTWAAGAGLLTLVSLQPVLAPSDTAADARAGLAALHLVVAAVVVVGLLRSRRDPALPDATDRRAGADVPAGRAR